VACTDATGGPGFCDAAGTCKGTGCFLAGTVVDTADGPRPIDQIVVGDLVRTADIDAGAAELHKVTQVQRRFARSLVSILLKDGNTIEVTPEHYFWVFGSGWVRAIELTPTDHLRALNGEPTAIASLSSRAARPDGLAVTVYNLVVEGNGTYFVGDAPVLVESCDYVNFSHFTDDDLPQ
jgi:hypothetical protein